MPSKANVSGSVKALNYRSREQKIGRARPHVDDLRRLQVELVPTMGK